ncbi:DUF2007 domain-containing protein [Pontibacter sp. FD36]|uniref:putative signal transducing protein n=1 Tax=unclassified Pontibacter TaxID=2648980 RepID=UPI00026BD969|nr:MULTISPECIES: DUF2007 domain-containing protein [unclassified Pontibacter]EJF11245.1 hypothetical protein O71_04496 [Pontibacter sp. BAB1700]MBF8964148.1 DUF2007 domain-containing protein [Pontibacter sp. FD36]
MAERLITVATFSQPTEAHILKGRLEAEGILCFLGDEQIIAAQPFYSLAVGGVKLQVTEGDVEEALELLGRIERGTSEYIIDDNIELAPPAQVYLDTESCPICESKNISARGFFGAVLGITLPFVSKRYGCHDCGYTWKEK